MRSSRLDGKTYVIVASEGDARGDDDIERAGDYGAGLDTSADGNGSDIGDGVSGVVSAENPDAYH